MNAQATTKVVSITPWWLVLLQGTIAIVFGVLLLGKPGATLFILVQLLGVFWMFQGGFQVVSLLWDRSMWAWKLFLGVLGVLAGVLVISNPLTSTWLLPSVSAIIIGIQGIFFGVILFIMVFQGGGWGSGIIGALSILLGALVLVSPITTAYVLIIISGAANVISGIGLVIYSVKLRTLHLQRPIAAMGEHVPS